MKHFQYDSIGKVDMSGIYNNEDPSLYFSTLERLDYRIPQEAKPVFRRLIEARREASGNSAVKLLDVGCSYGVNAALLKHGLSLDDLYRHYACRGSEAREAMLARDRTELFGDPADEELAVVGLDTAVKAVDYAVEAGVLDVGITSDLEAPAAKPVDLTPIEDVDLVISTGCYGYVTETSLERILLAAEGSRPWMAHFVLRMFDFAEAEEMLARHGYVVETLPGLHPQRRFASMEERDRALENVTARGLDPSGLEDQGWYLAELHVAKPEEEALSLEASTLLDGVDMRFN